jgi:hypothetical protein
MMRRHVKSVYMSNLGGHAKGHTLGVDTAFSLISFRDNVAAFPGLLLFLMLSA